MTNVLPVPPYDPLTIRTVEPDDLPYLLHTIHAASKYRLLHRVRLSYRRVWRTPRLYRADLHDNRIIGKVSKPSEVAPSISAPLGKMFFG